MEILTMAILRTDFGYTLAINGRAPKAYGTRDALQRAIGSVFALALNELD